MERIGFDGVVQFVSRLLIAALLVSCLGCGGDDAKPQTKPQPEQPVAVVDTSAISPSVDLDSSIPPGTRRLFDDDLPLDGTVFRGADERPKHDDERLRELGIGKYVSRHLVLYTDIEAEQAQSLPALADAHYRALERYFGPLPPSKEGDDFQMTGYIMRDRPLFVEAGLVPVEVANFGHGVHRGYEFWMMDQETDYYREHLMLHEATHCYMTLGTNYSANYQPVWYLEGMAELFGVHESADDDAYRFALYPRAKGLYPGFGRIRTIRLQVEQGALLTLNQVTRLTPNDFVGSKESYAWSWALCSFLEFHPRYRDRFRKLRTQTLDGEFRRVLVNSFAKDSEELSIEWELFTKHIGYGYDFERAAVLFSEQPPRSIDSPKTLAIQPDRFWQSSGLVLQAGKSYMIEVGGSVVLAHDPKPWRSEPQGITVRYAYGQPLGKLLAVLDPWNALSEQRLAAWRKPNVVGRQLVVTPDKDAVLYLAINDSLAELADNEGNYRVRVSRADNR